MAQAKVLSLTRNRRYLDRFCSFDFPRSTMSYLHQHYQYQPHPYQHQIVNAKAFKKSVASTQSLVASTQPPAQCVTSILGITVSLPSNDVASVCHVCVCATTTKSTTTTACELHTGDSCGDNRADNRIIITHVVMRGGDKR